MESTDPEPGSFIDDFEGARNISLFCDVRDGADRLQTVWSIQTAEDVEQGDNPGPIDQSRFILSGDTVMSGGVSVTLNTNLTLLELTADLDQAMIFCGASENPLLASFTLRIYSELNIHVQCTHTPQRGEDGLSRDTLSYTGERILSSHLTKTVMWSVGSLSSTCVGLSLTRLSS